jgi:hypothetical protein
MREFDASYLTAAEGASLKLLFIVKAKGPTRCLGFPQGGRDRP